MNALAAAACCLSLDISMQAIKKGLENMRPIKGRLEIRSGKKNVRIIDDTYNANPTSLDAAIKTLSDMKGSRFIVLGDMGELGQDAVRFHEDVGVIAKQNNIDGLFTIGDLSMNATKSFGKGAFHFSNYDELGESLTRILNKDTNILVKGSRAMKIENIV